jgi:hypothetical protein
MTERKDQPERIDQPASSRIPSFLPYNLTATPEFLGDFEHWKVSNQVQAKRIKRLLQEIEVHPQN